MPLTRKSTPSANGEFETPSGQDRGHPVRASPQNRCSTSSATYGNADTDRHADSPWHLSHSSLPPLQTPLPQFHTPFLSCTYAHVECWMTSTIGICDFSPVPCEQDAVFSWSVGYGLSMRSASSYGDSLQGTPLPALRRAYRRHRTLIHPDPPQSPHGGTVTKGPPCP